MFRSAPLFQRQAQWGSGHAKPECPARKARHSFQNSLVSNENEFNVIVSFQVWVLGLNLSHRVGLFNSLVTSAVTLHGQCGLSLLIPACSF